METIGKIVTDEQVEELNNADEPGCVCNFCSHAIDHDKLAYWKKLCLFYTVPIVVNGDYGTCENFLEKPSPK